MKTSKKIAALQSELSRRIVVPKPEQPMLSFNRICFGMMNNDWILVMSSGVKLLVSMVLLMHMYNK